MPSQSIFSLWTPLLKSSLCLEAHHSGHQIASDVECRVKGGTKVSLQGQSNILQPPKHVQNTNSTSVFSCTPGFKVNASLLDKEQCLALGTFLLPSITPIAAIDNYKVKRNSLTGLWHVVRHHYMPIRAKFAEQPHLNMAASPVDLAVDDAIVKIGRICRPFPAPVNTTVASASAGLSSFEPALSSTTYNKTSPQFYPSCSKSSAESGSWPYGTVERSNNRCSMSVRRPNLHFGFGHAASMALGQPSIDDLARTDPIIVLNPVQMKSSLPQAPSPADRQTFEALLEIGSEQSKTSAISQAPRVAQTFEDLPTSTSTSSHEKFCADPSSLFQADNPYPPAPIQGSSAAEISKYTVKTVMTGGSREANAMDAPSPDQEHKFLDALLSLEDVGSGHSPEHMSLFRVLIDGHGSQSKAEELDWLNIDRCHCPGLDTEAEELDLSRTQYRTPRAGIFRVDLISSQPSTPEPGTEPIKATVDNGVDSSNPASQESVSPEIELAKKSMVLSADVIRAASTRRTTLGKHISTSGPTTDKVQKNQAGGQMSLVKPPAFDNDDDDDDEDPLDGILDEARRAGGPSFTIRSAMKDAIFHKPVRRSNPSIRTQQSQTAAPGIRVKAAKAHPYPLSQEMEHPTNMTKGGTKKGAGPKQSMDAARPSQNIICHSSSDYGSAKEEGITKLRQSKHAFSTIPGRAEGNRARFMWIPHEKFNAVEVQKSQPGCSFESIKSGIDDEDPFAAEGAVYTSHTKCQLALAHAARMLGVQVG